MTDFDVVVVGLGAMGSAAAWQLARRGRRVLGLEQFAADHELGSSHGAARIFRLGYEHDDYVQLALEALPLWRELESADGTEILVTTGAIDFGDAAALERIAAAMYRNGATAELLDAAAARDRWPGIALTGQVLHSPDGGRTDADAARAALQRQAVACGADLRFDTRVVSIAETDHGVAILAGDDQHTAATAIVTTNAWTPRFLPRIQITVTQEQPAFFAARDAAMPWPSFVHYTGDVTLGADLGMYGLESPGDGGVKVGEHGTGVPVDPDAPRPPADPERLERLSAYVAATLPGLDPAPLGVTRCLYATTPSEDFVIDRVGSIVVGAGFSGHGFKFTPAIGRVLADLADGTGPPLPGRFRLPG